MTAHQITKALSMGDMVDIGCTTSGEALFAIGRSLRDAAALNCIERERIPSGVRLRVANHAPAVAALRDFVGRERECCHFFDFLVVEDQHSLSVTMTGPPTAGPLLELVYRLAEP